MKKIKAATLRAAIYARKSQESADAVSRQIENATTFAGLRGWHVSPEHIFKDDGISGAAFFEGRPGFAALLTTAKSRQFDVVVTMALDRLGRESIRTANALLEIVEAGVRVFFYNDGSELTLDTPISKAMLSLQSFSAEDYRHQVRLKTREAMRHQVAEGRTAGQAAFGYRNVGLEKQRTREIDPEQAKVVVRIFKHFAGGTGPKKIARMLNAEAVPSPSGRGWSKVGIYKILRNQLYAGRIVYGRTKWIDKGGGKTRIATDPSEWITRQAPQLRIVPEPLWQDVQGQHAKTLEQYPSRTTDGRLRGRPRASVGAYLLSGFLKCGTCGSNLIVITRARPEAKRFWICGSAHHRGKDVCANGRSIPYDALTEAVIERFKATVLDPQTVHSILMTELAARTAAPEAAQAEVRALRQELAKVEKELARGVELALAGSGEIAAVTQALKAKEREKAALQDKIEHADGLLRAAQDFDMGTWMTETGEQLKQAKNLLTSPEASRALLRRCISTPFTVTAKPDGTWSFEGAGQFKPADLSHLTQSPWHDFAKLVADDAADVAKKQVIQGRVVPTHSRLLCGGGENPRPGRPRSPPTPPRGRGADSGRRELARRKSVR